jgi:hypothetical protein
LGPKPLLKPAVESQHRVGKPAPEKPPEGFQEKMAGKLVVIGLGEYGRILSRNPKAKKWGWRTMRRNPGVYVRGRIRHADHRTITLHGWHSVLMNTETQSRAMRNVAFID